jgi:hypothetical protein
MRDAGPAILDQYIESENQHRTPAPQSKRKESTAGQRLFSTPFALLVHIPSDLLSLSLSLARSLCTGRSTTHHDVKLPQPLLFPLFSSSFRSLARSLSAPLVQFSLLFAHPGELELLLLERCALRFALLLSQALPHQASERESDLCIGRGRRH